jgi:putative copper export protein
LDVHLLFKYFIVLVLVLIIASLGKALYHLSSSKPGDSGKMLKALTWRIGLSVGLFVLLIVAYFLGWISPQH